MWISFTSYENHHGSRRRRSFRIPVAPGLVLNGVVGDLMERYAPGWQDAGLTGEDLRRMGQELKRQKKLRGPMELVHIEAADGSSVSIRL